jgi:hypothetical protein
MKQTLKKQTTKQQSIRQLSIGLALFVVALVNQSVAQSSPQAVAGNGWQALTKTSPTVVIGQNQTEYIAWKGANSPNVYYSIFNGSEWTPQQEVSGASYGSSWKAQTLAPPLLVIDVVEDVFLWWQDKTGGAIMYSEWDGASWSYPAEVSGSNWTATTNATPAVDVPAGLVVWKDASSDTLSYTYDYDGTENDPVWSTPQTVGGTAWTGESNVGPTLETFSQGLIPWLFWKGASSDHIWTTTVPQYEETWVPQTKISCTDPEWTAETSLSPAAAGFAPPGVDALYDVVFWKGSSSNKVWYTYDNTAQCGRDTYGWADQAPVSGTDWAVTGESNVAPALAFACYLCANNTTSPFVAILAWKNATDNTIWFINPLYLPGLSNLAGGELQSKR